MKNPLLQLIASGIALGLMGGSAAIHSLHVNGAKGLGQNPEWRSSASGSATGPESNIVVTESISSREMTAMVEALEGIVDLVQAMKSETESLQGQLEETNRDLMGIRFRLDTHSESFRPMPVAPGIMLEGSASPEASLHPLLPPK